MHIKTITKIFALKIIWGLSKIFCAFSLVNNKIFFLSYNGKQYSDSPKYISDYLLKNSNNLKIVWGFNKNFNIEQAQIPIQIKVCKKGSFFFLYHLMTAKEIVINDFISTAFCLRKNQVLLNTWHGGGTFKTIGMSRRLISDYDEFFYKAHAKNTTAFSLSSKYFKETVVTRSFLFFGETISCGMPRNAILFNPCDDISDIKGKVLQKYNISTTKPILIVLYAPTYRNYTADKNIDNEIQRIDFDKCKEAFERRFNKKTIIFNRSHHAMNTHSVKGEYIDVTDYQDMQELIIASDFLISDYSSCMWDFALTKKPIFVYAPDLEIYEAQIDFFMPAEKWAFPLARNNKELIENIERFDLNKYISELEDYMTPLESYEGPDSVKLICDWLDKKRRETI